MNLLLDLAKEVEETLGGDLGFDLPQARLWTVGFDDTMSPTASHVTEQPDVYELLASQEAIQAVKTASVICIATCGWAAPLGPDGEVSSAPSEHKERRRVRLMVFATQESTVSVLRFQDDVDDVQFDEGTATGSLADAVRFLFHSAGSR